MFVFCLKRNILPSNKNILFMEDIDYNKTRLLTKNTILIPIKTCSFSFVKTTDCVIVFAENNFYLMNKGQFAFCATI